MTFSIGTTRRALLVGGFAALLSLHPAVAADWPTRPIRLIVPFAPGGSNDILARVLAAKLGSRLGQNIIVENRGGAGGTIGTDYVAKSTPDGYTLLFVSTSITTNAASRTKLPFDPVKDLQPIGQVGAGPFVVVVSNSMKIKTLHDFIDLARAKPKSINYGSAGVGGINHLGTELFATTAKIQLVHVPYKGIGPAFNDLMAGNIQMALPTVASAVQHIHAGTMRGLAVTSPERSPLAPDLPTVSEAGVPGFQLEVWWGVVGPAGLPAPILERLNRELNAALAEPDVKQALNREGAVERPGTPDAFGKLIRSDLSRWKELIVNNHIQTE